MEWAKALWLQGVVLAIAGAGLEFGVRRRTRRLSGGRGMVVLGTLGACAGWVLLRVERGEAWESAIFGTSTGVLGALGVVVAGLGVLRAIWCGGSARRGRLAWSMARAAGLLAVAYGVLVVPRVRADGWVGAVPTAALIVGLDYLPERAIWRSRAVAAMPSEFERPPGDWTLVGRIADNRVWGWQQRWALGRIRQRAAGEPTVRALQLSHVCVQRLGTPAADAAELGFRGLLSDSADVRHEAAGIVDATFMGKSEWGGQGWALVWTHAREMAGPLIRLAQGADERVSEAALQTLSLCGDWARPAVPMMLDLAADSDYGHWYVRESLRRLARESPAAREELLAAAERGEVARRVAAIEALGWGDERNVRKALWRLMGDHDERVSQVAWKCLRGIRGW